MPLFVCENPECRAVENTARVEGWLARKMARTQVRLTGSAHPWAPEIATMPQLCSECITGRWHGHFPKRQYDPSTDPPFVVPGEPQLANPVEPGPHDPTAEKRAGS